MPSTASTNLRPPPDIGVALSELTALLLSDERIEELLERVARLAANGLAGVDACGATVDLHGRPHTIACTEPRAHAVDEMQYTADTGPCLEAMRTGAIVTVTDCRTDARWYNFGRQAVALDVLTVFSLPLTVGGRTLGVLNLYGREAREYSASDRQIGAAFAAQAALVLMAAARHCDQVQLREHLQAALTSRAVIDQAIGVTMAGRRCSPSQAFDHLRHVSQHRNVKLRLIAAETVAAVQPTVAR